ncbi:MAG: hypothetical protein LBT10_03465 [Methanobrevibacter sp.]|jgi:hypothetical protein|nr:hypothetical protein [Methanobrevibacter sp.]
MDRKLKILWYIIIIIVLIAIAFGAINRGMDENNGKIRVTNIVVYDDSQGLLNSFSVSCKVKAFVELPYLKMKTTYYDKDGSILSENDNCWEEKMIPNQVSEFVEMIGYNAGANGKLPSLVEILFFDDHNKNNKSEAIYLTSVQLINKDNNYQGQTHIKG